MHEPTALSLQIAGTRLTGLRAGGGDELVLFLHAVGGSPQSFRAQLQAVPLQWTAAAVDFRGHAPVDPQGTPVDADALTMEVFAADTVEVIQALGFRKAHLVGVSMGGVVAQLVHRLRPDIVSSLTLASTWAHYDPEQARQRCEYMKKRIEELPMLEGSRRDMEGLFAPGADKALIDEAAQIEGAKDPKVFLACFERMFAVDLRPDLLDVAVPTLLLGGPHDPAAPPDPYLRTIADAIPGSRYIELDGAGHFSNQDHAEAFNRELYAFLKQNADPGGRRPTATVDVEVPADTIGQALIQLLARRGVDALYSNSGTDFVDIIDAFSRYRDEPEMSMRLVTAPHENTAIAMAHGHYQATRRIQAVMAHVNVGSANMTMGIINAARARIPVLVLAGKTPWLEEGQPGGRVNFVQWGQDTYDQASFREFLKWDYELKTGENLETVIDRALAIAQSDPAGPVYLMLPGEVLASAVAGGGRSFRLSALPRQRPAAAGGPPLTEVQTALSLIESAEHPVVVTAELGRYRGGPSALARFADALSLPVIEFGKHNFMNMPTSHPMHAGFDPTQALKGADLLISVECQVPYIPKFVGRADRPRTIQIGVDPLYSDLPMRSFAADVCLSGHPPTALLTLTKLAREKGFDLDEKRKKRRAELTDKHAKEVQAYRRAAAGDADRPVITKRYLSSCIGRVVTPSTLIFNEYDLDPALVPRDAPGTWFENSIASGLGWALGAALGAKLALPERDVIATVGDGAYLFNTPLSAHFVAAAESLPIVVVIFNDRGWTTIKKAYRGAHPDGWAVKRNHYPLCDFTVDMDYAKVAVAAGGIGLKVERPGELEGSLREALRRCRSERRLVLVDVRCERDA